MSGADGVAAQARAACHEALLGLGLRKRAGSVYTFEVSAEVLGFVGLNAAANRPSGPYAVNPVVGARHQELEKVVAELTGEKPSAYAPPTVSAPLGYLMPEHRFAEWAFAEPSRVDAEAADLARALATYGLGFARSFGTLDAVVAGLGSSEHGIPQQVAVRLPVGLAMLGSLDRARAALDDELGKLGTRQDMAAAWFRSYATAFGVRFG